MFLSRCTNDNDEAQRHRQINQLIVGVEEECSLSWTQFPIDHQSIGLHGSIDTHSDWNDDFDAGRAETEIIIDEIHSIERHRQTGLDDAERMVHDDCFGEQIRSETSE